MFVSHRRRRVEDRRRGAMLIIALGVLTLLAVLGATFVQLMRLERKASNNYIDAQRMEQVVNSAIDRIIAKLHEGQNHYSWTFYKNTDWLFKLRGTGRGAGTLGDGRWRGAATTLGAHFRADLR